MKQHEYPISYSSKQKLWSDGDRPSLQRGFLKDLKDNLDRVTGKNKDPAEKLEDQLSYSPQKYLIKDSGELILHLEDSIGNHP
ncbi:hypothetical protein Wxf_01944 [Wolbachia endosymbiont of Armadillidium vulgare]|nr:hypothetical protein Wxf_00565 [Wolbachia endosymbiont of Armadillidium vulgare]OJH32505.1 hypothetical protein Wxf_01944 [Wolbachia endosymbiont of Armadillidium vulgare]